MPWSPRAVVYGSTDVVCDQEYQSLHNTLGQNPCLIYSYMVGSCANVYVQVQALNQSSIYPPPADDPSLGIQAASECTCSRTIFNLISACSLCQRKSSDSWANYNANCGDFDENYNFTTHVPEGTALPVWATKQVNATEFAWDIALADKGAGEFTSDSSTGLDSTMMTTTETSEPTGVVRHPSSNAATIGVSAAVGLTAMALVLTMSLILLFSLLWRKASRANNEKFSDTSSKASTVVHSALFNFIIFLSLILACITTWTAVALKAGGFVGRTFLINLVNFLVFVSWWTFVGASFFLLAFLYDRCNREGDGSFSTVRLGSPYGHLTWLVFTWILWVLGAPLFAASVAQAGTCQLHCSQLRVIPVLAFMELVAVSLALAVVLYSYWNVRRRSRLPKRLGRSSSHPKSASTSTSRAKSRGTR